MGLRLRKGIAEGLDAVAYEGRLQLELALCHTTSAFGTFVLKRMPCAPLAAATTSQLQTQIQN